MILKQGQRSLAVLGLQKKLNATGAKLYVDGDYGPATTRAVRNYQLKVGLVADGIAGPKTHSALAAADTSKLLKQADIERAAADLGVEIAAVMAVNLVESAGSGFIDHRPVILFERHQMRRQLLKHGMSEAEVDKLAAVHHQIINRKPGGYIGGLGEHQKLQQAQRIHPAAAIESCSWGAFQIMGYHWELLGYKSAQDYAAQMHSGESAHLDALVRFIEADPGLHKALKARKWADFAKRYNGPSYAQNLYDVKMARAYKQFSELLKAEHESLVS